MKYQLFIGTVLAVSLALLAPSAFACGAVDLAIEKSGPAAATVGQTITYSLHTQNLRPRTGGAFNISVTDNLPQGATLTSWNITSGPGSKFWTKFINENGNPTCSQNGTLVTCKLPYFYDFNDHSTYDKNQYSISLQVQLPDNGTCTPITNVASIHAALRTGESEANPVNNTSNTVTTNLTGCPTPTPSISPTPSPTATPSPTPTPSPSPTPEKKNPGITVSKTDHKEITRPSHTLTYEIRVENTGEKDMQDVRVVDTLPSHLVIKSVGQNGTKEGQTVRWNNVSLEEDQVKTFTILVEVNADTKNNTTLHNIVTATSDDHDVSDEASDDTLVKVLPQVAGIQTPPQVQAVPVTARTGATGIMTLLASTLMGGSGLAYVIRKGLVG